jgi:hypothetical protein
MNTIKFSHAYSKFFEDINGDEKRRVDDAYEAILLEVFTVERKALCPAFVEDDTLIEGGCGESYPLVDGLLLVLLFRTKEGFMFTTIRRWTEKKAGYYRDQRGNTFEVIINDTQFPTSAEHGKKDIEKAITKGL